MDATQRRNSILNEIIQGNPPVSATVLAKRFNVSRQVIVGDIALLRAQGQEIIATSRGYIASNFRETNQYIGKVVCQHNADNTKDELYTIVDSGAVAVNVIVEHEIYGEITGQLNVKSHEDADVFIDRLNASEVKLLSELTMGVHLHTVTCRDKTHFDQLCRALDKAGYLYKG